MATDKTCSEEEQVRILLARPSRTEEEYRFLAEFLRYSEQEKAEANRNVSLESLLAGLNIYFPAGKHHPQRQCFLPGHPDDTPSMTLYREHNHCYCFGCRTRLTPLEVLVRLYGRSYPEAMDYLLGDCLNSPRQMLRREILAGFKGRLPPRYSGLPAPVLPGVYREAREEVAETRLPEVLRLLETAVGQYQAELVECPPALAYLKSRGLTEETIQEYRLGYSSGVWLSGWLRQTGQDLKLAKKIGLLAEQGRERLAGRVILPYRDPEGQLLHLTGRFLFSPARAREILKLPSAQEDTDERTGSPKYLGLALPKPGIAGIIRPGQEYLLLVEGPFDWLIARQWGYNAACLFGTGVAASKLEALKKALDSGRLKRLYLCLDNDPPLLLPDGKTIPGAGLRATREILEYLGAEKALKIPLPAGVKDLGSLGEMAEGQALFSQAFHFATNSLNQ
jgi:DNA primase